MADGHKRFTATMACPRASGSSRLLITSDMANTPIAKGMKPMPSISAGTPNVKRGTPLLTSVPMLPEQQPENDHGERLVDRTLRNHDRCNQAQYHERAILRRAEKQSHLDQERREKYEYQRRDATGEKRCQRGNRESRAGTTLARHLVPVDAGNDGGILAWQPNQNGRRRAAILRAVVKFRTT